MNCFCLVATLQTPANQRLIFRSHEVSPGLQTACAATTAVPENNRQRPEIHTFFFFFTSERETLWLLAANSANHEGHFSGS